MKKVLLLLGLFIITCNSKPTFVGNWKNEEGDVVMQYFNDNTFLFIIISEEGAFKDDRNTGTYKINNNIINLNYDDWDNFSFNYEFIEVNGKECYRQKALNRNDWGKPFCRFE